MEITTRILVADEDAYTEIGEAISPLNEWSGIEIPNFDPVKLATLHALLTHDPLPMALDFYEPIFSVFGDYETLIFRVADELTERLAQLDEDSLESMAVELAATEAFEDSYMDNDDVFAHLSAFAELAQLADSQGQVLFASMIFVD